MEATRQYPKSKKIQRKLLCISFLMAVEETTGKLSVVIYTHQSLYYMLPVLSKYKVKFCNQTRGNCQFQF